MTDFLLPFILAASSKPAANVPLGFVYFKNTAHLTVELRINHPQAFGYIFMYGGFTDVEFLCGRTDGRFIFENILPQFHRSIFYDTLHAITPYIRVLYTI